MLTRLALQTQKDRIWQMRSKPNNLHLLRYRMGRISTRLSARKHPRATAQTCATPRQVSFYLDQGEGQEYFCSGWFLPFLLIAQILVNSNPFFRATNTADDGLRSVLLFVLGEKQWHGKNFLLRAHGCRWGQFIPTCWRRRARAGT